MQQVEMLRLLREQQPSTADGVSSPSAATSISTSAAAAATAGPSPVCTPEVKTPPVQVLHLADNAAATEDAEGAADEEEDLMVAMLQQTKEDSSGIFQVPCNTKCAPDLDI